MGLFDGKFNVADAAGKALAGSFAKKFYKKLHPQGVESIAVKIALHTEKYHDKADILKLIEITNIILLDKDGGVVGNLTKDEFLDKYLD